MVFLKARGQSERTRHRPRATGASFFIGIRDAVADAAFWLMKFNEWMEMLRSLITEREVKQNKKKGGNQPSGATDVSGAANLKLPGPLILETSAIQQTRRPSWLGSCTSAKCKWRAWKLKFLFFPSMRRYIYFETFSLSAGSVSACCTASINGIW